MLIVDLLLQKHNGLLYEFIGNGIQPSISITIFVDGMRKRCWLFSVPKRKEVDGEEIV